MFHISIWGDLELCLGGLSQPKPPCGDGTVCIQIKLLRQLDKNCLIGSDFNILISYSCKNHRTHHINVVLVHLRSISWFTQIVTSRGRQSLIFWPGICSRSDTIVPSPPISKVSKSDSA